MSRAMMIAMSTSVKAKISKAGGSVSQHLIWAHPIARYLQPIRLHRSPTVASLSTLYFLGFRLVNSSVY